MEKTINTQRLVLRPLCEADAETTHQYAGDVANTAYMIYLPNKTMDDTKAFLRRVAEEWAKENPAFYEFAILWQGQHIGAVSVSVEDDGAGELGWILHRDYQGHGYATEAAEAVKGFAVEKLGLTKLEAHCDQRNAGSVRVMEKLGMVLEKDSGTRTYSDERGTVPEYKYAWTAAMAAKGK